MWPRALAAPRSAARLRGCGSPEPSGRSHEPELRRRSVDVDKFDYIQRDCLNCGVKNSCDFERITMHAAPPKHTPCF